MQFIDLAAQQNRIKPEIEAAIQRVLAHGQYILGPEVDELEARLVEYTGAGYCISCANGTDALQIALMALEVGPGDEVITPAFTYISTAEAAAVLGALPVYVDIVPETYALDPALLEQAITERTKAIIPVSLYGLPANMDEINAIAGRHGIRVIEDAAQSFGATYKGAKSGNLSAIATTSFFPAKPLGCYGDGGAIFTSDADLAARMRKIARHGQSQRYHHDMVGCNSRLDTIQAAILLEKLRILDSEIAQRQRVASLYDRLLGESRREEAIDERYGGKGADSSTVPQSTAPQGTAASGHPVCEVKSLPVCPTDRTHVFAQYTIEVKNRPACIERLKDHNIPSAVHYPVPLHKQPAFQSKGVRSDLGCSVAASEQVLSLPMHPYLEPKDQSHIIDILLGSG